MDYDVMALEDIAEFVAHEIASIGAPVAPSSVALLETTLRRYNTRRLPQDIVEQRSHNSASAKKPKIVVRRGAHTTEVWMTTVPVCRKDLQRFLDQQPGDNWYVRWYVERFGAFVEEHGDPADKALLADVKKMMGDRR